MHGRSPESSWKLKLVGLFSTHCTLSVAVHRQTSYITLNVVGQACPLRVHGDSRSRVSALDVGDVIRAVVKLEKKEYMDGHDVFVVAVMKKKY